MHLLPKSDGLLEDLFEHARLLRVSADELNHPPSAVDGAAEEARHAVIVRVLASLRTTFLTPLDRDDLHDLAIRLDRVSSRVATATLYRSSLPEALASADLVASASRALQTLCDAVAGLRDEKQHDSVREQCRAVRETARSMEKSARDVVLATAKEATLTQAAWQRLVVTEAIVALSRAIGDAADAILAALLDS